jgi:cation diffusion facilitator CzcD-associated flavoprotein CzcO
MAGRWLLETSDGPCGAAVLVLATGPWHVPRRLEVPGIEEFNGPVLHTARWDHGVDSAGRRVTVVGSGASAVQVVPAIEAQAASVGLFQRTAQWVLPKSDLLLPAAFNRLLDRVPGARGALLPGGTPCRRALATPAATLRAPASSRQAPAHTCGSRSATSSYAGS